MHFRMCNCGIKSYSLVGVDAVHKLENELDSTVQSNRQHFATEREFHYAIRIRDFLSIPLSIHPSAQWLSRTSFLFFIGTQRLVNGVWTALYLFGNYFRHLTNWFLEKLENKTYKIRVRLLESNAGKALIWLSPLNGIHFRTQRGHPRGGGGKRRQLRQFPFFWDFHKTYIRKCGTTRCVEGSWRRCRMSCVSDIRCLVRFSRTGQPTSHLFGVGVGTRLVLEGYNTD